MSNTTYINVASLVAEYKSKMMMEDMPDRKTCSMLPFDGYIVLDSGTVEYLTKDEFNKIYKPLE